MDSSEKKRIGKGALANYIAAIFQSLIFLFHIITSQIFGQAAYGAYVFAWSVTEMASKVAIMGTDKAVLRGVATARANGDSELAHLAIASCTAVVLAASLVVFVVITILANFDPFLRYGQSLVVLAPVVLTWSLCVMLVSSTMALGTMKYNLLVRGIGEPSLMLFAAIFFGLALQGKEWGPSLAHLAASTFAALLAIIVVSRHFALKNIARMIWRRRLDKSLLKFSVFVMAAEMLNQSIYRLDIVFLGTYSKNPEVVASYGAAALVAGLVSSVRYAFDPLLSPMVAECTATGQREKLRAHLRYMTKWVTLLALTMCSTLAIFGDMILSLWGGAFVESHKPLLVLLSAHAVNAVLGLHQWAVVMSGRSKLDLLNNFAGFVVIVLLNISLIPLLGALGAATATLCGNIVYRGLQVIETRHFWGTTGFDPVFLKIVIVSLAIAAGQLALRITLGASPLAFLVSAAFGVALATVAAHYFGLASLFKKSKAGRITPSQ